MTNNIIKPVGKIFPNLNERIASYDPATQLTIFERMNAERFHGVMKNIQKPGNESDGSIIAHEYRHCADHLGTLWGQKYLLKLQKALDAVINKDVELFSYILEYKNEEEKSFSSFMNGAIFGGTITQSPRESLQISVEISENKEKFINDSGYFLKINVYSSSKEFLFSMPITIMALLEANAMYEEIAFKLMVIHENYGEDSMVYSRLFENEVLQNNQNFNLSIYNNIAQITATLIGVRDWPVVYLVASHITTLTLNLPSELIKRIPITNDKYFLDPVKARLLLEANDLGFIYYTLCKNYGQFFETKIGQMYSLDALLKSNNLPSAEELKVLIIRNIKNIKKEMAMLRFRNRFLQYNRIGLIILKSGGIDGGEANVFTKFNQAKWYPPYALIDAGAEYQDGWLAAFESQEDNLRNANAWFNTVKELDNEMELQITKRNNLDNKK